MKTTKDLSGTYIIKRQYLEQIDQVLVHALVALGDQDTILERGHWGNGDKEVALAGLKAARTRLAKTLGTNKEPKSESFSTTDEMKGLDEALKDPKKDHKSEPDPSK